jgi:hypothetical protein
MAIVQQNADKQILCQGWKIIAMELVTYWLDNWEAIMETHLKKVWSSLHEQNKQNNTAQLTDPINVLAPKQRSFFSPT